MGTHTQTIWARLDDVRLSDRRARCINVAKVARYREWLEEGRIAPPVRLARNGGFFVVRDGRHRVAAALAAGHAVIEAELHRRIAALLGRTVRRLAAACSSRRLLLTAMLFPHLRFGHLAQDPKREQGRQNTDEKHQVWMSKAGQVVVRLYK